MDMVAIERSVLSFQDCHDGAWFERLDLAGVRRIIVGTGPGSFAGVRSAIAFAQGYALGKGGSVEVLGVPSPVALAEPGVAKAVIGDARQGKFWLALLDGFKLITPVFQVEESDLEKRVPRNMVVVSPDDARIGEKLRATFDARYLGLAVPTAEGLLRAVRENPALCAVDPAPIYLNPAVR
jgi:tRNA A37 threonylcarbamoyladenosine modification protein TsaB